MSDQNTKTIDLGRLSEPFDAEDIEWRVSRSGTGKKGVYCHCLAYITARAIQARLDEVCGPENWHTTPMETFEMRPGKLAVQVGIAIRIGEEWVTKYDVAEPTNIEPAKGGYSGAMKRAGAQWGIGRYLYHLEESFAEVSDTGGKGWNYAQLPEKHGGGAYYWKPPSLPAWALPKEPEHELTESELSELKRAWKEKFAPTSKNPSDLREGFTRLVHSVCGEFPVADYTCWTRDAYEKCLKRIRDTTDAAGPSSDVPFDAA